MLIHGHERMSSSWTQELWLHSDKEQINQSQQQNMKQLPTYSILWGKKFVILQIIPMHVVWGKGIRLYLALACLLHYVDIVIQVMAS